MGYPYAMKWWRLFNLEKQEFCVLRDVVFYENEFTYAEITRKRYRLSWICSYGNWSQGSIFLRMKTCRIWQEDLMLGCTHMWLQTPIEVYHILLLLCPTNEPVSDLVQTSNVTPSPSSTLPSSTVTAEPESSIEQSHNFDRIIRDGLHRSHCKTLSPIRLKHIFSQTRIN